MTKVFISYNRQDQQRAVALSEGLLRRNISVWLDQRDLPVSVPWLEEIEVAVRNCRLFVILDSPAWQDSENCLAEEEIANRWIVPVLQIRPGMDTPMEVSAVADWLGMLDKQEVKRSEIRTLTGDWLSSGKSRARLARGRGLSGLARVAAARPGALPTASHEFLAASTRQQRRRTLLASAATVITGLTVSTLFATNGAFRQVEGKLDAASASFSVSSLYSDASAVSPYAVLSLFTNDPSPGLAAHSHAAEALSASFPVNVRASSEPLDARTEAVSPDGRLHASSGPESRVTITEITSGQTVSTTAIPGLPTALAWSPDSSAVAVGVGDVIEIIPASSSSPPHSLTGGKGRVNAVAWTDDTVSATTDAGLVLDWSPDLGGQTRIADSWLVDSARVSDDSVAVLDRNGELSLVDVRSQDILQSFPTGISEASWVSVHEAGEVAIVVGDTTKLVDLLSGDLKELNIPDCIVTAADFTGRGDEFVVGCGQFTVVAVRDGEAKEVVFVDTLPISISASGATVLVGDLFGVGVVVDIDSAAVLLTHGRCGQTSYATALAPDGSRGYVGGSASGTPGCAMQVELEPGTDPSAHPIAALSRLQPDNRAIALSPDGTLAAWGYSDGSVVVHDSDSVLPLHRFRPFQSDVRGLEFLPSGLVAVSRDGDISELSVDMARGSVEGLRERAADRLRTAREQGLW